MNTNPLRDIKYVSDIIGFLQRQPKRQGRRIDIIKCLGMSETEFHRKINILETKKIVTKINRGGYALTKRNTPINLVDDFETKNDILKEVSDYFIEEELHELGYSSYISDISYLSGYSPSTLLYKKNMTIYGLKINDFAYNKKDNFSPEKLSLMRVSLDDMFLGKKVIKIDELMKNVLAYLQLQKKNKIEMFTINYIEKEVKTNYKFLRNSLLKYKNIWGYFMASTNVTKNFLLYLKFIETGLHFGFRRINYKDYKEIELLRQLVPQNESSKDIESLKKQYEIFLMYKKREVPYEFVELIRMMKQPLRKQLVNFFDKLSKVLFKEELYPIEVSIVAHTHRNLINTKEFINSFVHTQNNKNGKTKEE